MFQDPARRAKIVLTILLALAIAQAGVSTAQPSSDGVTQAIEAVVAPETKIRLPPSFVFGGRLELETELQQNFDLEAARADELAIVTPELQLNFSFEPSERFQVFLRLELSREIVLEEGRERESEDRQVEFELKQGFLLFKDLADGRFSLQVGRQKFRDKREWLYDEELDAIRGFVRFRRLRLEIAVGREALVDLSFPNDKGVESTNYYLFYGEYALSEKVEIAAYALVRDEHTAEGERQFFLGLRSHGTLFKSLDYWVDLGHVNGKEDTRKIRGFGLDLGVTYRIDFPFAPSLTVGYAFGGGDADPEDRVDKNFRQTGLQDNSAKFHGVTRLKYYGELFDPELSNLMIFTSGVGVRPTRSSSIALFYHYYLQHKASTELGDAEIEVDPTGLSRELGSEIDLIAGWEPGNVEVKLVLGYFMPGEAFGAEADRAFLAQLRIRVKDRNFKRTFQAPRRRSRRS